MKISRQWQLRPGPRHLHHNNMQPTVARMGRGGGINRILGILSYYFCPCAKLVGAQQERGRERGTRVEHYITILPFHYGIKLIGSLLWKVPWNWSLDLCQTPKFPLPGPGAGLCLPSHLVPFRSPAAGDIIHMPRPGFYEKKIQNLQNTCPALNERESILVGSHCNV